MFLYLPPVRDKLDRFARKRPSDRWQAIKATLQSFNQQIAAAPTRMRAALDERYRRRQVFRDIYKRHLWGNDGQSPFFSGVGSRGEYAAVYVNGMAELLQRHIQELGRPLTVVDLGCGDFEVGRELVARIPDLAYIGCDIVPELIEHNTRNYATDRISFRRLDIVTDPLPIADVCLVRQVLQHLSNAEIIEFVRRANYNTCMSQKTIRPYASGLSIPTKLPTPMSGLTGTQGADAGSSLINRHIV